MTARARRSPTSRPRPRVDAETRHRLILEAASEEFARRPFHEVTTRQLARAAGVSEALLFQHFSSKRELYMAVVRQVVDEFEDSFRNIVAAIVELPEATVERIEKIFREQLEYYFATPGLLRSFLTEAGAEEVRRTYYRVLLDREADMLETLQRARRNGLLPDVDPRVLLRAFIGQTLVFVVTEEWLGGRELGGLDRATLPRELARLWAGLLSAAPAAGSGGAASSPEPRPAPRRR